MTRLKIVPMDRKVAGYFAEMHPRAARSLGLPYPHGPGTLAILRTLPSKERAWHMEHGRREYAYMEWGMSYGDAHARTLLDMGDYSTMKAALRDSERMIKIANRWKETRARSSLRRRNVYVRMHGRRH